MERERLARGGRTGTTAGVVVAALIGLAACGESPGTTVRPIEGDHELLVADGWPDATAASEPLLPWSLEAQADVVAVGRVHEPREHDGRSVLELELTDFLKGRAAAKTVFPDDAQPFLGCLPPETLDRPSELFPAGSEALVYLNRREGGGVSILQLLRKPDTGRLDAIRRFVGIEAALREPAPKWSELLPPDGTLDSSMHWALVHVRPAGADAPLRAMLGKTLDGAETGERPAVMHLNLLAGHLTQRDADPASLPLLERLARWILALPEDDPAFRSLWPACSPGALLAQAPADAVPRWEELLRQLLRRSGTNEYAIQGTANALAQLPKGAGVPALLDALGTRRSVIASALAHWARGDPDDAARRSAVRERAKELRTEAAAAGDAQITFRRHLDVLLDALKD